MVEQAITMRLLLQTLHRYRRLLAIVAVLGAVAGVGLVLVRPPAFRSTSLVLLAPGMSSGGQQVERDMSTEERIASSGAVLDPVRRSFDPPLSRRELDRNLDVTSSTSDIITIEAAGVTRELAQVLAKAVAESLVSYQSAANSSLTTAEQAALQERIRALEQTLGTVETEIRLATDRLAKSDPESAQATADAAALSQLTAQQADLVLQINALEERAATSAVGVAATILEAASPAERPHLAAWYVFAGLLGALASVVLASAVVLALSRHDPRLRSRDDIADALGRPVLASLSTRPGRDPAQWRTLLIDYAPEVETDLALRQVLLAVGLQPGRRAANRTTSPRGVGTRLTVISLSDDPAGLAVAPQLAAHAAALGLPTRLIVLPGHPSATTLEAACSGQDRDEALRPNLWVDTRWRKSRPVELTVSQVILDRQDPEGAAHRLGPRAMIAVSAGSATQEELARAAVWTYNNGGRVLGALVADPDEFDRTSGRLLGPERAQQVPLPTRLTGLAALPSRPSELTEGSA